MRQDQLRCQWVRSCRTLPGSESAIKTVKLAVIVVQDEDGYFVAEVPVLKHCFTQGRTRAEALANIKEVIQLRLEHTK